jgi:hypothetical protein
MPETSPAVPDARDLPKQGARRHRFTIALERIN